MRTLLVMRHAKSSWGSGAAADVDRPLAPRGVNAARRMGRFLADAGWLPGLVVSSPARRARETVDEAADAGHWGSEVTVVDALYDGGVEGSLAVVSQLPDDVERAMLAGHEPTCSTLLSVLLGGGSFRFPTGAAAAVAFEEAGWSEVAPDRGQLLWMVVPRLLPDA